MPLIELDSNECGQLMAILAHAEGKGITWAVTNPLLMKIGGQLREQAPSPSPSFGLGRRNDSGAAQEVHHE